MFNKRKNARWLVRVRVELTTLALSAPRSADWANGPDMVREPEVLVQIIELFRSLGALFYLLWDTMRCAWGEGCETTLKSKNKFKKRFICEWVVNTVEYP